MLSEALAPYAPAVAGLALAGSLLLIQLLVADFAGIRARHRPGMPIEADPARFLFRASRAHANTNESLAAFVALLAAGVLAGADPRWLNGLVGLYLLGRLGHMVCYYARLELARSVAFGVSLLALCAMAVLVLARLA